MPANLPPEYREAEQRYHEASTTEDKIAALKEMMSLVPNHKGTEKLRVDLNKRLNKLEQKAEKEKKQGGGTHPWNHVEPEGAGQVVIIGLPNAGKSTIVDSFTNAEPEVAEYPYTTFEPTIGMMPYEDIQIQLIDLPPLSEFTEGWTFNLIRQADGVVLAVDLGSDDPAEDVATVMAQLEENNITLVEPNDPDADRPGSPVRKKTLLIATKPDMDDDRGSRLQSLTERWGEALPIVSVVAPLGEGEVAMKEAVVFGLLQVVRVYSKKPTESAASDTPFILARGSTVLDAAEAIHREFAQNLDFARIWGSARYDGQRVERQHVVDDGDVLEIHV